jgi:hypothetical protein
MEKILFRFINRIDELNIWKSIAKARDWLRNLLPKSIDNFDTLCRKFLA